MSDKAILKALKIIEDRKSKAYREKRERVEAVYANHPDLEELDKKIGDIVPIVRIYRLSKEKDKCELNEMIKEYRKPLLEEKVAMLMKYGISENYDKVEYSCPICKDTGYVGDNKCSCLKLLLADICYKDSNLDIALSNQRFENAEFAFYSDTKKKENDTQRNYMKRVFREAFDYATSFPNTEKKGFLLTGTPGTSKTFLCSCIAHKIIERNKSVLYISAEEMTRTLEDDRFGREGQNKEKVSLMYEADLLIIDDLGTEVRNSVSVNLFFNLVNQRMNEGKHVIFSTNLSLAGLAECYSQRIVSRILGHCEVIQTFGDDLRLKMSY